MAAPERQQPEKKPAITETETNILYLYHVIMAARA